MREHWSCNEHCCGANLTCKNIDGWTPLIKTSGYDLLNVVKLLINRGVPLNDSDMDDTQPYMKQLVKGNLASW